MEFASNGRIRLTGLNPDSFISPRDRAALENIQRLPVLPAVLRKFNELALDRVLYATNSAESIRCGPRQYPSIYRLMREACEVLDVPEPELYVRYDERYNAMTAGVVRPFIVIQSSLLNDFTDDELLYVIGHELGHIKCGHVLYQMVGRLLVPLLEAIGDVTLGIGKLAGMGLLSAFFEWLRQAEFSCDRAGLLACQRPKGALSAIMKLGGGTTRFDDERNLDAFLDQARGHVEMAGLDRAGKALAFLLYNWQLDHPQVVFRARGLDEWIKAGDYERILSGSYERGRAEGVCGHCGCIHPPGTPCVEGV